MYLINNAVLNHISQVILDGKFHLLKYVFILLVIIVFLLITGLEKIIISAVNTIKPGNILRKNSSEGSKKLKFS
ncbi:MAG: hypothetical protein JXR46_11140 [Calditrichaceae bacterium]|nr:hypothetical protein [Calditrichaceae bacterium]MBN2709588.1 hypothetical protein [Calditrichaceae bacterium]RQV92387.1 MAG: hypothetical protein EH224_15405 [Calditrichota bacterium]